jgi:hypothetical protein
MKCSKRRKEQCKNGDHGELAGDSHLRHPSFDPVQFGNISELFQNRFATSGRDRSNFSIVTGRIAHGWPVDARSGDEGALSVRTLPS